MSGELNYAEMFDRIDTRRRELEDELAKLKPLLATLAPLANRDDPAQVVIPGTPPPVTTTAAAAPEVEADKEADDGEEEELERFESVAAAVGIYTYMNSQDAALHFMRKVGGRRSTIEVADALRAGGFRTKSPHFINNTYTTMRRLAERGLAERVGSGLWELTEAGMRDEASEGVTAEGEATPPTISEDQTGEEASGDTPRLALAP